jgi:hypothetical protein
LSLGDVLFAVSEAGLTLEASETEDTVKVYPAANITPELAAAIRVYKSALIRVALEDRRLRETGVIHSERQVFELAREFFGKDSKGRAG